MGKALPVELRERAVDAYLEGDDSYEVVAARFAIGVATLIRWVERKRERNDLRPDPSPGAAPLLDATACDLLTELFDIYPTETLDQIGQRLFEATGKRLDTSTVCRYKQRLGFSQKKRRPSPANATKKRALHSAKRSARLTRES